MTSCGILYQQYESLASYSEESKGRNSIRRPAAGSELLRVLSEPRGKFRAGTDRIGANVFCSKDSVVKQT